MARKHRADIGLLVNHLTTLSRSLGTLSRSRDLREILVLIRKPGWTTPAEFLFAIGIVDSMIQQVASLQQLKKSLLAASRRVART